jgi:hypothetical protein
MAMKRSNGRRKGAGANTRRALDLAREHYQHRAWTEAYQAFLRADLEIPLAAADLERLAMAAYLVGRDAEYLNALERAYNAHRDARGHRRAVRCAFWLGFRLLMRGETGHATGWFSRAQRLLEHEARECAEQGYLLAPVVEQHFRVCGRGAGRRDRRALRRSGPHRLRAPSARPRAVAAGAGPGRTRAPG